MFELGKRYILSMADPSDSDSTNYLYGIAVEFNFPVLKLKEDSGEIKIINTSSRLFISAEPETER